MTQPTCLCLAVRRKYEIDEGTFLLTRAYHYISAKAVPFARLSGLLYTAAATNDGRDLEYSEMKENAVEQEERKNVNNNPESSSTHALPTVDRSGCLRRDELAKIQGPACINERVEAKHFLNITYFPLWNKRREKKRESPCCIIVARRKTFDSRRIFIYAHV